jgi:hypothetical protein
MQAYKAKLELINAQSNTMFEKMKGVYKTVKGKVVEIEKKVKMAEDIFTEEVADLMKSKVKQENN